MHGVPASGRALVLTDGVTFSVARRPGSAAVGVVASGREHGQGAPHRTEAVARYVSSAQPVHIRPSRDARGTGRRGGLCAARAAGARAVRRLQQQHLATPEEARWCRALGLGHAHTRGADGPRRSGSAFERAAECGGGYRHDGGVWRRRETAQRVFEAAPDALARVDKHAHAPARSGPFGADDHCDASASVGAKIVRRHDAATLQRVSGRAGVRLRRDVPVHGDGKGAARGRHGPGVRRRRVSSARRARQVSRVRSAARAPQEVPRLHALLHGTRPVQPGRDPCSAIPEPLPPPFPSLASLTHTLPFSSQHYTYLLARNDPNFNLVDTPLAVQPFPPRISTPASTRKSRSSPSPVRPLVRSTATRPTRCSLSTSSLPTREQPGRAASAP